MVALTILDSFFLTTEPKRGIAEKRCISRQCQTEGEFRKHGEKEKRVKLGGMKKKREKLKGKAGMVFKVASFFTVAIKSNRTSHDIKTNCIPINSKQ